MLLIGVNRAPDTRRVAITLTHYRVPHGQRALSGFDNRADVRGSNPPGRIPAVVLDGSETLVDSGAIIDHLDEIYAGDRPTTPRAGPERRAVLRVAALMMGACDKLLQAAYERNRKPAEKQHPPWIDDCVAQAEAVLAAVDAMIDPGKPFLLLDRLAQADICAVVAERLARAVARTDTEGKMPRLRALTRRLSEGSAFQVAES